MTFPNGGQRDENHPNRSGRRERFDVVCPEDEEAVEMILRQQDAAYASLGGQQQ